MNSGSESKYRTYLKQLIEFQKQGESLNLKEFESWKMNVSNELTGNFKIRFDQLRFYTISEEIEYDDLPF